MQISKEIKKYDVFISYSHKDREWVSEELLPRLKKAGLSVAIDSYLLTPGDNWKDVLSKALRLSRVLISVFSPSYFKSEYALKELDIALRRYKNEGARIFPISLGKFELNQYGNIQFYDFSRIFSSRNISDREFNRAWDLLIDAIIAAVEEQKEKDRGKKKNKEKTNGPIGDLDGKILGETDGETRKVDQTIPKGEENTISKPKEVSPKVPLTMGDVSIDGLALSDAYSQIDLLGYSDYVEALANFITSPKTKKPITIGIDAAWGGGKTTLMRLLQERLNPRPKNKKGSDEHINTVWFDAWKYDQQEMLWAAMVLEILSQVRKQFNWWQKTTLFFRLNFKRLDWARLWLSLLRSIAITVFVFALGFGVFSILASFLDKSWSETLQWIEDYSRVLVALGVASLAYTIFKDTTGLIVSPFSLGISQYAKKPDYKEKIGFLNKFTEDFKDVIESITKNGEWPLVVFIDDLDRCAPTKAAEVIEAMNLLLDSEHCVFILGVDTAMLSRSIQAKYKEIQPFFDDGEYPSSIGLGRHFLEKIIQIDFRIPRSDSTHISDFISAQLGNEPKKQEPYIEQLEAENLIQAKQRTGKTVDEAKKIVLDERPDLKKEIDNASKAIDERTFEDNDEVIEAINDMAFYLNNNPRRIKRFINMFRLQALIAYQREILKAISFNNLARWVVIGMRWPEFITFFRQDSHSIKSIKDEAIYIDGKLKGKIATDGSLLDKYPKSIQNLLRNSDFRKIIAEITGNLKESQKYLNLTQPLSLTNDENIE